MEVDGLSHEASTRAIATVGAARLGLRAADLPAELHPERWLDDRDAPPHPRHLRRRRAVACDGDSLKRRGEYTSRCLMSLKGFGVPSV